MIRRASNVPVVSLCICSEPIYTKGSKTSQISRPRKGREMETRNLNVPISDLTMPGAKGNVTTSTFIIHAIC
jgi:hypothetical protein